MTGPEVVARARRLIGVRFRAQGRDPAFGVDCVGLVAAALGVRIAADHPLRSGDRERVERAAEVLGLTQADGARAGDVLLFASGPGQLHLGVRSEGGLIHADAGARRVVERPGDAPWPLVAAWRMGED
jgi:lipoprotein Spr